MPLPAFIIAAGTIGQTLGPIAGGVAAITGGHPKDGERYAANRAAYDAALAGDDNALLFLQQRTGSYGVRQVPGYGEVGGWATQGPKDDAATKYSAALSARRGQTALQAGSDSLGKIGDKVKAALDDTAAGAGKAAGQQVAFAILGAAVLLLLFAVIMRKRKS